MLYSALCRLRNSSDPALFTKHQGLLVFEAASGAHTTSSHEGIMKTIFRWMLALALALATTSALAAFHFYRIEQVFSDASGNVQFVVMHESAGMSGEQFWTGHPFTSTHLGTTKTFVFPNDLPVEAMCMPCYYGCCASEMMSPMMPMMSVMPATTSTANTRVLIATQGFADLHILTPDYIIPNGFLPTDGGTISYASGTDQVTYSALPTDGVTALKRDGTMVHNVATNFAGQSASVTVAAGVDLNQHGLTGSWFKQATSGQGVEVEVFANPSGSGSTFVSWFTYDTVIGGAERQRWYTAQGQMVTGQPSASLTIFQNTGGNFNALPITNAQPVGTATLSFDTCTSGQLTYSFTDGTGRTGMIPLTRLTQNVTCSTTTPHPTNADFAFSGNWYDAPNPTSGHQGTSGQGLTVEVNPNSGALFAAWYTYAPMGAGAGVAGQRWYTAQPTPPTNFTPGMRSIPVTIYETTGGMFDTPTPPGPQTVAVGAGTLAFQSCSAATFSYLPGTSIGLSNIP
jgi:hypothetical protein